MFKNQLKHKWQHANFRFIAVNDKKKTKKKEEKHGGRRGTPKNQDISSSTGKPMFSFGFDF